MRDPDKRHGRPEDFAACRDGIAAALEQAAELRAKNERRRTEYAEKVRALGERRAAERDLTQAAEERIDQQRAKVESIRAGGAS